MSNRVGFGKQMESKIISALRELGWEINPSKPSQDMNDKIDAWVNKNGKWIPAQIKYRDSGDEFIVRCVKGWSPRAFSNESIDFNGRDMVGGAKLYICLNQSGTEIRICSADEAKETAKSMVNRLAHEFLVYGKRIYKDIKGEARILPDPSNTSLLDVIAFIKPSAMSTLQVIKVKSEKGLWAA